MSCRPAGDAAGKLKAIAAAWASGRGGKRQLADDDATAAAVMPAWMERRVDDEQVEIAETDAPIVGLFMALDTQWRWHAMTGQRIGLDYTAIAPTAALLGVAVDPAMMMDLRTMEAGALEAFARRSAQHG